MKVKELSEILKVDTQELLELLNNVGVAIDGGIETNVDKEWEKKLAKRYNVPYPFKTAKPAPKPSVTVPKATEVTTKKEAPKPASAGTKNVQKPTSQPQSQPQSRPHTKQQPTTKPRTETNAKPLAKTQVAKPRVVEPIKPKVAEPTKPKVGEVVKPKKVVISKHDEVLPRLDEKTLHKYEHFFEDDEYNITRENITKENRIAKKKERVEEAVDIKQRRKNIKNKKSGIGESRASNIPINENDSNIIYYEYGMTVADTALALNVAVTDLVKKLFLSIGIMAGANDTLDRDSIELIAMEYKYEIRDRQITDMTRFDEIDIIDEEKDLVSRPPVVTIMGHVDHGKTTLLDTIRSSHVTQGEAGGITQHIGAYQVEKNGRVITFVDTPGHAAFTEMRARGAQITDIVILVVAADDGVMPQTIEAIEHAQAAQVPIIVAINKMDRPGADPGRIKQMLTEYSLLAEEWGGETIFVEISALKGEGVAALLEMVLLTADFKDYKANPNRLGVGTVIEAKLDKGRGPVATLLVQNGTIKIGDIIVVGNTYGKIRAMQDEKQNLLQVAGPSKAVEITGIEEVPFAGEKFMILENERRAREIASTRAFNKFEIDKGIGKTTSLAEIFKNQNAGDFKQLNLIIKCDVQGSIEAIKGLLEKIKIEGTKINIVAARVGGISDTDINLAIASEAIVIGFNIRPQSSIVDLAKDKGIEIRLYNIIYKLQEDIEKAVKGMLDPVYEEKITGQADVREIFKVSSIGTIAGCYITSGYIPRGAGVRLIRNSIVVYTGRLSSLKRFKDDVKEVRQGYDCGLTIERFNDIKVGDMVECYIMEEVERN